MLECLPEDSEKVTIWIWVCYAWKSHQNISLGILKMQPPEVASFVSLRSRADATAKLFHEIKTLPFIKTAVRMKRNIKAVSIVEKHQFLDGLLSDQLSSSQFLFNSSPIQRWESWIKKIESSKERRSLLNIALYMQ